MASRVEKTIEVLNDKLFIGEIGIVTPFRLQANEIRIKLNEKLNENDRLRCLVETVVKFQGDEKDIIIFSPVVSDNMPKGVKSYYQDAGNLLNVAITRARAKLYVIGNFEACLNSDISHINAFAKYVKGLSVGIRDPVPTESIYEQVLFDAMKDSGLNPLKQFVVGQYRLDFAIIHDNLNLNIEVDGKEFHTDLTGEKLKSDIIRNQRLQNQGWKVIRFWAYEIRDSLDYCINRIKDLVETANIETNSNNLEKTIIFDNNFKSNEQNLDKSPLLINGRLDHLQNLEIPIIKLIESDSDFLIKLLSIHYPFSAEQIESYWDLIFKGDAHYSVYISDTGSVHRPKIGLCFNPNIQWTDKLKYKWEWGFDNHFNGYIEGAGRGPVEFSEYDNLIDLIPLSILAELEILDNCSIQSWISQHSIGDFIDGGEFNAPEQLDVESYATIYQILTNDEFINLFHTKKSIILYNASIWNNSLKNLFSESYVNNFFKNILKEKAD